MDGHPLTLLDRIRLATRLDLFAGTVLLAAISAGLVSCSQRIDSSTDGPTEDTREVSNTVDTTEDGTDATDTADTDTGPRSDTTPTDTPAPDPDSDSTDTVSEDTRDAGGSTLPDWADHRLTIGVEETDAFDRSDYHLVVSGEIRAPSSTSDDTFNGGRYGVASSSVWPGSEDEFVYSGRLLSIKLRPSMVEEEVWKVADSAIVASIDGKRVDHESFDPSHGDLAYGFMGYGQLPDDMRVERDSCDTEVTDRSEFVSALEGASDGETICVIGDIHLPEGPGTGAKSTADEITLAGFPADDGTPPKLYRRQSGDWGWGNVAVQLTGDRVVVQDLEFEGPGVVDHPAEGDIPPDRVIDYEMRGLEFTGNHGFVVNVDAHHFSQANISARGRAITALCVDSHHPWPSGGSYGIAGGGPLDQPRDYPGDRWPDEKLENGYMRWHNRLEIRRVLLDGGRHDTEAGTHGTYSLDQFVIGRRGVGGGRIDMHRPGGGVWRIGHGAIYEHANDGPDIWMRGWPEIAWRVHDVWFADGEEPDMNNRYPNGNAPIVQVCATPDTRVRRKVWDNSSDPYVNFEYRDCLFGDGHPSDIDPELGYYYDNFYDYLAEPSPVYSDNGN